MRTVVPGVNPYNIALFCLFSSIFLILASHQPNYCLSLQSRVIDLRQHSIGICSHERICQIILMAGLKTVDDLRANIYFWPYFEDITEKYHIFACLYIFTMAIERQYPARWNSYYLVISY